MSAAPDCLGSEAYDSGHLLKKMALYKIGALGDVPMTTPLVRQADEPLKPSLAVYGEHIAGWSGLPWEREI